MFPFFANISNYLRGSWAAKEVLLLGVAVILGLGMMALGSWTLARRRRTKRNVGIHGNAHFQDERELRRTGLLDAKGGVYLAGWRGRRGVTHYLRDDSDMHVIIVAPTRSGKSLGPIAMTLLSWPDSVIVNDIKGELWALSAQWRHWHAHNRIYRWEPSSPAGVHAFNFLQEVRLGTIYEIGDAQNIALGWINVDGMPVIERDHWRKTSSSLLAGCILHLLYREQVLGRYASLADVATALSGAEGPSDELWEEMRDNRHLAGRPHPLVAAEGESQIGRSDRERSSIWSTLQSFLTMFLDPIVAANTNRSDFRLADIADGERPISVYIVTPGTEKDRLRPLVRFFLLMVQRHLMSAELVYEDGRQRPAHRHTTLMAIDELPDLELGSDIESLLSLGAGYRIKCLLSCQAVEQLAKKYGNDNSILGNCHIRIVYTPNDLPTAQWVSDLCGQTTAYATHVMESGRRWSGVVQNFTRTIQEVPRPLLPTDEAMRLRAAVRDGEERIVEPGEAIVIMAGHHPIRTDQVFYFRDPEFLRRASVPA